MRRSGQAFGEHAIVPFEGGLAVNIGRCAGYSRNLAQGDVLAKQVSVAVFKVMNGLIPLFWLILAGGSLKRFKVNGHGHIERLTRRLNGFLTFFRLYHASFDVMITIRRLSKD
jgi:hypothetical protein